MEITNFARFPQDLICPIVVHIIRPVWAKWACPWCRFCQTFWGPKRRKTCAPQWSRKTDKNFLPIAKVSWKWGSTRKYSSL